ncbi:hypothetical protein M752DRAFT_299216 [Aspergillus phoenicis ATCC 13157]|uniref:Uncharacterized protein n=1 Tax=Aspergillus phoenicis ATCC 13157 TaxID=1353007 RepID=A0A370P3J6_ASPPH|nr:hypothetical protein M752DRAFT_299216 [Aspergillus phoenicis ATCC 13157]GLA31645.1 hypothetical protein AnigIFM63326_010325 [Aspergillus niger]
MYNKLNQEIAGARQRPRNALLIQIETKYDREQPMLEIRRRRSGFNLAEEEKPLKCSGAVPLPQKRLIQIQLTQRRPTLEEVARRTEASDAMAGYALCEEGDTCRPPRDKLFPPEPAATGLDNSVNREAQLTGLLPRSMADWSVSQSVMKDRFLEKGMPLFCFIRLGHQDLDIGKQTYKVPAMKTLPSTSRQSSFVIFPRNLI